jgi:hypothetical protein
MVESSLFTFPTVARNTRTVPNEGTTPSDISSTNDEHLQYEDTFDNTDFNNLDNLANSPELPFDLGPPVADPLTGLPLAIFPFESASNVSAHTNMQSDSTITEMSVKKILAITRRSVDDDDDRRIRAWGQVFIIKLSLFMYVVG